MSGPLSIARAELLRVLVPNGVAVFVNSKSEISDLKLTKPRPADIDDWTHYLHGPDNSTYTARILWRKPNAGWDER